MLNALVELAARAARPYAALSGAERADFLDTIAFELEAEGDSLLEITHRETHLPLPRLTGERARTTAQLRMFAELIRTPDWMDLRRDVPPEGTAKPDLRRTMVPLGPVVVFGASNFPYAFSVPGGDTASALAAGCPVIVKAHPAHPETSRRCSEAIQRAARRHHLPDGVFGLIEGGVEAGQELVKHAGVKAVAFTGSHRAGRALFDLANARPTPIPVFAEMGSVNPVFLLPGALETRGESIAAGFVDSVTLGVGQFCTNPGVIVALQSAALNDFVDAVRERLANVHAAPMLTAAIESSYVQGVEQRAAAKGVDTILRGSSSQPSLFRVSGADVVGDPRLHEELFGPSAVLVVAENEDEFWRVAESFEGQLTATLHLESSDVELTRQLVPILTERVGRLIANGFPTGVEVATAMHHGGPYPATTDSRWTSVGTAAILRFVRPVCFQNFPETLLPTELR